ncbi:hypothetical protein PISMIDRAFT_20192 [Pisolithus microcarpus 441]|uniref:Uncharacterized protein n=1 Tax=Pisolithus microcarpus 441 TaxID=765257 RepID=A0A0C9Y9G5_9AGAM|nr:hypothetical protein PISMIDRAFT_20192 [Pisolithus microcarpus 441]
MHTESENDVLTRGNQTFTANTKKPDKAEGLVGESHSFGDSVRCTTEQSQVVYDGVTYTPNNTTFERELGLAKVGDTHTGLSQYVVQEAKRVCEASYGADAPVNVSDLDSLWWPLLK